MSDSQENGDRSERVSRLREELRRVIEREYALCVKYRELAASFRTLMPDENLRHDAVLQALATTLKLDRETILGDLRQQHEELAMLEEEATRLFAGLRPENGRLQQAEPAAYPHCPKCGERNFKRDKNGWTCHSCSYEETTGSTGAAAEPAAPPAQRKCSRCGGQMHFHAHDGHWLCYTCAHEELPAHAGRSGDEGTPGPEDAPRAASAPSFAVPLADTLPAGSRTARTGGSSFLSRTEQKTKTCPVCRKRMDWHKHEKRWRCFFCHHKMR